MNERSIEILAFTFFLWQESQAGFFGILVDLDDHQSRGMSSGGRLTAGNPLS
jgi:hypothetical protein